MHREIVLFIFNLYIFSTCFSTCAYSLTKFQNFKNHFHVTSDGLPFLVPSKKRTSNNICCTQLPLIRKEKKESKQNCVQECCARRINKNSENENKYSFPSFRFSNKKTITHSSPNIEKQCQYHQTIKLINKKL